MLFSSLLQRRIPGQLVIQMTDRCNARCPQCIDLNSRNTDITCLECDWECFRDPSELFGPLLQGLSSPLDLAGRCHRDAAFFSLWMDDLKYYRACGLFDGRTPPDYNRMQRF